MVCMLQLDPCRETLLHYVMVMCDVLYHEVLTAADTFSVLFDSGKNFC